MKLRSFMLSLLLGVSAFLFANNTQQTVTQVTEPVTIGEKVDYHISSATPFATTGSVEISSAQQSVVIFDNLLPSKAKAYLANVTIDGAKAVAGTNCQLRIYRAGCMILPYTEKSPLTVCTQPNYKGTSENKYEVNTIYSLANDKEFNNSISSFKLKRGYMVCFATQSNGQGYNRVFIADHEDLEFASLPKVLDGRISFIRISKWNNVIKRGWAGYWSDATQEMLNTGWAYNWDASNHNGWTDREYVTQHHHEGWPGIADVGNNTGSANILGNNEPENSGDDREHLNSVDEVLANWPQMMATGRRLGSPAVSGDYNWLYKFIDSIDARGWRCDFIAVHAYWYADKDSWKSQLENISKRCGGRPIWITEMNYGANWTGWPGSDRTGSSANYAIEKQHMAPILDYLNDASYIERFAFYNNVNECRYAIADGKLTPIGEYYSKLRPAMAYNSAKEFIPKAPRTEAPKDLTVTFVPKTFLCTLSWLNPTGEFADSMFVERKKGLKGDWERIDTIAVEDNVAKQYTYKETVSESGNYYYRIHIIDYNNKDLYSSEVTNVVNGTEGVENGDGSMDVQWGKMVADNTDEAFNLFAKGYTDMPAVVFGSVSNRNPSTQSVNNVTKITKIGDKYSYFASRFFPWNCSTEDKSDYSKGTEQTSFLVSKAGNGTLGTLRYEAGLLKEGTSVLRLGGDTVQYKFNEPFEEAPVVFVTPISTNTQYPCEARVWDVTKDGFKVVMTRQKGISSLVIKQRVSYFALEKGATTVNGVTLVARDTTMSFINANATKKLVYGGYSFDSPIFLCQLQSFNRKVSTLLRTGISGPLKEYCQIRLVPDTSDPNKTINSSNPFKETIGWLCIGKDQTTGITTPKTSSNEKLHAYVSGSELVVADASATSVKVYTLAGMLVAQSALDLGEARFSLGTLPNGILLVKANSGKAMKVLIKR